MYSLNIQELVDKANKAMHGVIGKCGKRNQSIYCKPDMFDKVVKPIILYGCEMWSFNQSPLLERFYLKFSKYILNHKLSTSNYMIPYKFYMVQSELGRHHIAINVKVRMVSFRTKLQNSQWTKISLKLYYKQKCSHLV